MRVELVVRQLLHLIFDNIVNHSTKNLTIILVNISILVGNQHVERHRDTSYLNVKGKRELIRLEHTSYSEDGTNHHQEPIQTIRKAEKSKV